MDFRVALLGRVLEITLLQTYLSIFGLRNIEPVALLQIFVTAAPLATTRAQHPLSKQQANFNVKA